MKMRVKRKGRRPRPVWYDRVSRRPERWFVVLMAMRSITVRARSRKEAEELAVKSAGPSWKITHAVPMKVQLQIQRYMRKREVRESRKHD
jgi:hypothetical protein